MTYLPETRRQLLEAAGRRAGRGRVVAIPRVRLGWLLPALSLVVAVVVTITFLGVRTQPSQRPVAAAAGNHVRFTFRAEPTPQVPVITRAALERTVEQMRGRLTLIRHSSASIEILTGDRVRVELVTRLPRLGQEAAARVLASSRRLEFYDWEANVLLSNGKTQASRQQSEPGGRIAPTALSLYRAVELASRQPYAASKDNSRIGSQYYLFERSNGLLLNGPLDAAPQSSRETDVRELEAGVPRARLQGSRILTVKQGTVVVEAERPFRVAERFGDPGAAYYVLRDRVALFGNQITDPLAGATQSGQPDVRFGLTPLGTIEFRALTAKLAHRGELESTGSLTLEQHFAVTLDNELILVSGVDFKAYPDGITGSEIHLSGSFIRGSARRLTTALQLGALPVKLKLLSAR